MCVEPVALKLILDSLQAGYHTAVVTVNLSPVHGVRIRYQINTPLKIICERKTSLVKNRVVDKKNLRLMAFIRSAVITGVEVNNKDAELAVGY